MNYEISTPDLWEELKRQHGIIAALEDEGVGNAPFTSAEQAEISERLEEIQQYARKTYELSGEQMASIEQRLEEAREASQRIGRKDWLLLLSGTAFNLIVTDLVPPGIVQSILTMTLHGVAHIFGVGGPPPPIAPQA